MKTEVFLFCLSFLLFTACGRTGEEMPSSKIYFWSDRDGQMQIYMMNPDGSNQRKISKLPDWEYTSLISLSPNKKYVAVGAKGVERDKNYIAIYALSLDGVIVSSSSPAQNILEDMPIWSPDSTYVAFYSVRDGNREIYSMKYGGNEIKRLTNNPDYDDICPVWSPDGKRIAYQSGQMGTFGGYFMNPDGSNILLFMEYSTSGTGYHCPPISWSSDSKWGGSFGTTITHVEPIYTMHVVSPDMSYYCTNIPPVWSPDNKTLLFETDSCTHNFIDDIYAVGIDGTMLMNLTNNDSANDTNPVWSPDGQYIIFESNRDGDYEIYCMKQDRTELIQLTDNSTNDKIIDWKINQ